MSMLMITPPIVRIGRGMLVDSGFIYRKLDTQYYLQHI
jgi:hypothetical protein